MDIYPKDHPYWAKRIDMARYITMEAIEMLSHAELSAENEPHAIAAQTELQNAVANLGRQVDLIREKNLKKVDAGH